MNGPEHYAEADRLLASVTADLPKRDAELPGLIALVQMAQAHATLALAASTSNMLPAQTHDGDQFVYDGIGKRELDRLRGLLSHTQRDKLTTWEVVETAADELERALAEASS